jgi:hypothetical protein
MLAQQVKNIDEEMKTRRQEAVDVAHENDRLEYQIGVLEDMAATAAADSEKTKDKLEQERAGVRAMKWEICKDPDA